MIDERMMEIKEERWQRLKHKEKKKKFDGQMATERQKKATGKKSMCK